MSNAPFRASVEQAPIATTVFDLQAGTMIFFNPAMERLFGFTLAEELELSPE